ncbi:MAG: YlbF family regulator [Ruminococcaceae bacterium]|nr:YlbF family regulator [Oscillospiraceae bacterium]
MEEILTQEMKDVVAQLGALVKADKRCRAIEESIAEYERSEELNSLIAEYNAQQNLLADAYGKTGDGAIADDIRETVQARIEELYDQITAHPVYVNYVSAKEAFDALTNEIYGELQFVITGQRPCSHNCASCHSDCGHEH